MKGDRILGILMLLLAVAYGWEATQFPEPFGGPQVVGPDTFPLLLSVILGLSSLYLIMRPDPDQPWPALRTLGELALVLVVLMAYASLLSPLGFIVSTTFMVAILSWRLGAKVGPALLTGVGSSVAVYLLFNFVLELHLPAGILELI